MGENMAEFEQNFDEFLFSLVAHMSFFDVSCKSCSELLVEHRENFSVPDNIQDEADGI